MKREEYFRRLQAPFDWELESDEQEVAVRMAREHGGEAVLKAWHAFQAHNPCSTFGEFEGRFEEYRNAEGGTQLSLSAMFEEHLKKRRSEENGGK